MCTYDQISFFIICRLSKMAGRLLPQTFQRLMVTRLTPNFREAVEKQTVAMLQPGPSEVLVKNRYRIRFILPSPKLSQVRHHLPL